MSLEESVENGSEYYRQRVKYTRSRLGLIGTRKDIASTKKYYEEERDHDVELIDEGPTLLNRLKPEDRLIPYVTPKVQDRVNINVKGLTFKVSVDRIPEFRAELENYRDNRERYRRGKLLKFEFSTDYDIRFFYLPDEVIDELLEHEWDQYNSRVDEWFNESNGGVSFSVDEQNEE